MGAEIMTNIQLFIDKNRISPYAMSVYVALKEKGLSFDETMVDLDNKENKLLNYGSICLSEKVHCLQINDNFTLFESLAITEFLENKFINNGFENIYPVDICGRAICCAIQSVVKTDFLQIKKEMPSITVFERQQHNPNWSTDLEKEINRLIRLAEFYIKEQWIAEKWSIADFDLSFMLNRLIQNQIVVPEKLMDYVERNWQRHSIQSWLAVRNSK